MSKCLLNMSAWKLGEAQNSSAFFLFVVVFFPADTALTKNNEISKYHQILLENAKHVLFFGFVFTRLKTRVARQHDDLKMQLSSCSKLIC